MPELDTPNPPPAPAESQPLAAPEDLTAVDLKDEAKVKGLIAELGRVREQVRELKPKAEKYEEVAEWYGTKKAVVDFVEQHPDLLTPKPETSPDATPADEKTVSLARALDLYDAQGKPDVARATVLRNAWREDATAAATEAVKPVAHTTARERAIVNYRQALTIKAPDGRTPNPETLATMFRGMPLEVTADEGAAAALAYAAIGYDVVHNKPAPTPPDREPVFTENVGGGRPRLAALSEFDRRIAQMRDQKPDTYQKLTEGFKQGQPNTLEDE